MNFIGRFAREVALQLVTIAGTQGKRSCYPAAPAYNRPSSRGSAALIQSRPPIEYADQVIRAPKYSGTPSLKHDSIQEAGLHFDNLEDSRLM